MRIAIAVGLFAATLGLATTAVAAPNGFTLGTKKVAPFATPVPKFQLAACRFAPCNCHYECITWDQNGNCVRTYRTCDTCSTCD